MANLPVQISVTLEYLLGRCLITTSLKTFKAGILSQITRANRVMKSWSSCKPFVVLLHHKKAKQESSQKQSRNPVLLQSRNPVTNYPCKQGNEVMKLLWCSCWTFQFRTFSSNLFPICSIFSITDVLPTVTPHLTLRLYT